ncbi:Cro/CI family transcriptional regulator [Erwinia pyrifoliae]|uniref:Cro/CI family transcriptional regulator n=1 Tax=Erwinia pyrifoliae TaxID=79967 RepID=A0ABY5XCE1_ERWPY|nr:Cro/CI family transcriptional regulator [Erwinia pyrifoliae]AUX72767.1 transcriptional regulator Cro [Erwinia pyrifoliae]MCA8876970.1 transcriptional regulator Cro [Erwinia pyrifoliae]MCT2387123.1 Cro/CI family transcriptional regulator [Erwinia pyrifoliae]MCU8587277.1 Cro/CI family transcriptional regulator [Erwinia pyrifoliae]UWS31135.1 Cro/CI family transcriptional regulator [Erwinia pyrifoliae]
MYKEDAIKFFGSKSKLAAAANVTRPSVTRWGRIIPKLRAMELAAITNGALQYEADLYAAQYNGGTES